MPIAPVKLFDSDPGKVVDFSAMSAGDIFNKSVLPRVKDFDALEYLQEGDSIRQAQLQRDTQEDLFRQQADDQFLASLSKTPQAQGPIDLEDYSIPVSEDGVDMPVAVSKSAGPVAPSLTEFVKGFEGFSARPYWDNKQWSIGYGTKATGQEGPITKQEAEQRLAQELAKAREHVVSRADKYGYKLNDNEIDALTSFAYNVGGIDQLTDSGRRSKAEVAAKIAAYNKSAGKPLKGLATRRAAEQNLFLQGYQPTQQ